MGNCLKAQAADDMSLLPGSDAGRFSASSDQLGIPPTYDPEVNMAPFRSRSNVGVGRADMYLLSRQMLVLAVTQVSMPI